MEKEEEFLLNNNEGGFLLNNNEGEFQLNNNERGFLLNNNEGEFQLNNNEGKKFLLNNNEEKKFLLNNNEEEFLFNISEDGFVLHETIDLIEKDPHPCNIFCNCLCAPCLCCCDCLKNACKENKKVVLFLISSFIFLVTGVILFKLYYPKNVVLWILGIAIGGFLPVTSLIITLLWFVISGCIVAYRRTKRDLLSQREAYIV